MRDENELKECEEELLEETIHKNSGENNSSYAREENSLVNQTQKSFFFKEKSEEKKELIQTSQHKSFVSSKMAEIPNLQQLDEEVR